MMYIHFISSDTRNAIVSCRDGEQKIGESIQFASDMNWNSEIEYVILGVPEDIGVRANYGNIGAENAFNAFLMRFLNMQINQYIDIRKVLILGVIDVEDLKIKCAENSSISSLRENVDIIDSRLAELIAFIHSKNAKPIVIGGGHNNSFGIIKGMAQTNSIEVLNIDPHFDYRISEGRHSGNGFRYAKEAGFLHKYSVFGFHQNYNNQKMIDDLREEDSFCVTSFESILFESRSIDQALKRHIDFHAKSIGVELDLDSVKDMPSSANTPSGFSEEEIRKVLYKIRAEKEVLYYHFAEGAPIDNIQYNKVGKFLAYLVADILAKNNK
jgi:formiminoglutamase